MEEKKKERLKEREERLKELRLRLFNKEPQLRLPDKEPCLQSPEVIHAQPEKPRSQKIAIKKVELRCKASHTKGPHMNKQNGVHPTLEETDLNPGAYKAPLPTVDLLIPSPENPHTHTFPWEVI